MRRELTVAKVMTKAALFEQMLMSGSTAMIFLTLDTACVCLLVILLFTMVGRGRV